MSDWKAWRVLLARLTRTDVRPHRNQSLAHGRTLALATRYVSKGRNNPLEFLAALGMDAPDKIPEESGNRSRHVCGLLRALPTANVHTYNKTRGPDSVTTPRLVSKFNQALLASTRFTLARIVLHAAAAAMAPRHWPFHFGIILRNIRESMRRS